MSEYGQLSRPSPPSPPYILHILCIVFGPKAANYAPHCKLLKILHRLFLICDGEYLHARVDAQIECEFSIDNLYKQFKAGQVLI